ncbi:MAG: response regulator [Methylotenera sp.]|nr:response regulator [Methylotenera sp.]
MMKKILIVDDHADIRRLIRMTLEFEDYEVREAADGQAALAQAQEFQPDLVLLDVMMPGDINGLDVCRRLRAAGAPGRGPRVIMLSARGQASDREAGLQAGADTYLVKPFSPLQLISCIGELWAAA